MASPKCLSCPSNALGVPSALGRRSFLGTGAAGLAMLVFPSACGSSSDAPPDGGADGAGPSDAGTDTTVADVGADTSLQDATVDAEIMEAEASTCTSTCGGDAASTLAIPFSEHPGLKNAGGSLIVQDARYKDPVCDADFVMIAHPATGGYVAFSGSCTHRCCQITFTGTSFSCPCHGSTYNLMGEVTGGPAPLALQQLEVCSDSCGVYVQIPLSDD